MKMKLFLKNELLLIEYGIMKLNTYLVSVF